MHCTTNLLYLLALILLVNGNIGLDLLSSNIDLDFYSETAYKCIPLPTSLSICKHVGYSKMKLPNHLGHDTVKEVIEIMTMLEPLYKSKCHQHASTFLCSIIAPVCIGDRPEGNSSILPCRSFCQNIYNKCLPGLIKLGFQWPHNMRCEQFAENTMCIREDMLESKTNGSLKSRKLMCDPDRVFHNFTSLYCHPNVGITQCLVIRKFPNSTLLLITRRVLKKSTLNFPLNRQYMLKKHCWHQNPLPVVNTSLLIFTKLKPAQIIAIVNLGRRPYGKLPRKWRHRLQLSRQECYKRQHYKQQNRFSNH
ncbi:hypothetical protein GJ496_007101 [Pomphorhynchus laevis]|nr:hypothetical protein GJ496_007101 [Pomphorhynchus laevis]